MSSDLNLILYSLLGLDLVLFIALFEGYSRYKRRFQVPKVGTTAEAFNFFEQSYKHLFPNDADGFTWKEAVEKASDELELPVVDRVEVENLLRRYEAERYGGMNIGETDPDPILKLAMSLREMDYLM